MTTSSHHEKPQPMKIKKILLSIFLVLITLCIYWQARTHGFYTYDDGAYIADNAIVLQGITLEGIKWALFDFHVANWHPVTWFSHMLDTHLFGANPSAHHLVSVIIHALNASLVFILLLQLTSALWRSFAVALLFAIHPLHVESVVWIAERKDHLSGLFFLLTLIAWVIYVRKQTTIRYVVALSLFVLGLMSKSMLVTLPFILLLLDWWPLGRFEAKRSPAWLFTEKIPFILLSVVFSIVTFLGQHQAGAVVSFDRTPIALRLGNAIISYGVYLRKMLWPNDLVVFYPFPTSIHWWSLVFWGMLLVIATIVFLRTRIRYPYLIVGWLWYLGMLFPVIGVIRVGAQAMADRYTYLPLLGPFIMIIWGAAEAATSQIRKTAVVTCVSIASGLLTYTAWLQVDYWKDDSILFSRVLEYETVTPLTLTDFANSYIKKGLELKGQWNFEEALKYFNIAAARSTGTLAATAHNNIGLIMAMQGKEAEAIREYELAIKHDPTFSEAYFNMGLLDVEKGHRNEAAASFKEVVRLNPKDENAHRYLHDLMK